MVGLLIEIPRKKHSNLKKNDFDPKIVKELMITLQHLARNLETNADDENLISDRKHLMVYIR